VAFAFAVAPHAARAQNLTWSPTAENSGGTGTWDTTDLQWFNGTILLRWDNTAGTSATFGGAAGTVTTGEPIRVQNVTFGNIPDNTALIFNRSDDVTYGGVISGMETVACLGTITLTEENTHLGRPAINGGRDAHTFVGDDRCGGVARGHVTHPRADRLDG
jgi:hypothetical protein